MELRELWARYRHVEEACKLRDVNDVENPFEEEEDVLPEEEEEFETPRQPNPDSSDDEHLPDEEAPPSRRDPIKEWPEHAFNRLPPRAKARLDEHKHDIFNSKISYRDQVRKTIKLIYNPRRSMHCGPQAIGALFGVKRGAMGTYIKRAVAERRRVGRPSILNARQKKQLIQFICEKATEQTPPNYPTLLNWLRTTFDIEMKANTLAKKYS